MEASQTPPGEKTPKEMAQSPDPEERAEGLRLWVAQLDRKLGTRFFALGAATVLALAAGIVAVVMAMGLQDDSAKKAELTELRDQVESSSRQASNAAEDDLAGLEERLTELESSVEGLRGDQDSSDRELKVVQDDIADLRDQISQLEDEPPADESSNDESSGGQSSP